MIRKIKLLPLITPKGEEKGVEYIVEKCPRFFANVNAKKSCSKCPSKQRISFKTMEVDCKLDK